MLVSGTVEEWQEASNWGGFDQKSYYEQQGIGLFLKNGIVENVIKNENFYFFILNTIKQTLQNSIEKISSTKEAPILKAMILGEKEELEKEQKEIYQKGGISHILAISGVCFLCWVFLIGERMA